MDKQFPKVVVGCFIFNDKREVLLVKSYKWPGKWVVMGGHIEWGETIADTCVREVKEEVGLNVKFVRVIEVTEFIFSPDFHDQKHFIGLQSECSLVGDPTPKIDHDEIQKARWFPLSQAAKIENILPVTRNTIRKIQNSK
ncbi:ADP-ribose pyrophosphatase [Candidatus Collierbacteria bacterium CG10_big_fil_rev_8_21_14_0_10_44_9]|uniref:ADP-ribose pyrophosphatase n=1 Tax=Candidatus Collierbacteria bacterium CG10_big_fil_rev_8_21_14_0_10_44_9 TaxID=1974535 RepID=A0A2H0VHZ9_9BACT|nr:MAG: ADP-ribose pyrophosphatase [Candidatus Collierbacteria bacterium CG10_big_fil_rev_8_21_14_0_10_44_9]